MPKEYLDKIRAKYPEYSDMGDSVLASKILAKYPEYQDVLGDMVAPQQTIQRTPPWYMKPVIAGASAFLGGEKSLREATKQGQQGNWGGAVMGALNAGVQEATAPLSAVDYAAGMVPGVGGGLQEALRLPGKILGYPGQKTGEALAGLLQTNQTPPDVKDYNTQQAAQLGSTASQFLIPEAIKAVSPFINKARAGAADAMSQSAYKIPPMIKESQRSDILHTAQEYGINPTKKGMTKIQSALDDLRSQQTALEDQHAGANSQPIARQSLVDALQSVKDKWSKSDTPDDFNATIDEYAQKLKDQLPDQIPLKDAIALKRNLQEQLSGVYAKQMKINPSLRETVIQESKSAIESEARKILEQQIPGYSDVNAKFTKLLKLKPFVEQAMNRISNQDITTIRLKDLMFGGAVGEMTHDPIKTIGAVVAGRFMTDPRVQSWIANQASPVGAGVPFKSPVSRIAPFVPASSDATKTE